MDLPYLDTLVSIPSAEGTDELPIDGRVVGHGIVHDPTGREAPRPVVLVSVPPALEAILPNGTNCSILAIDPHSLEA